MSKLLERHLVQCPYNLAKSYLAEVIGPRAASGDKSTLDLSIEAPGGELVKHVIVVFGTAVDPMHFDQPWHIHWTPKSGPYPEFDGQLTVRADETYEVSALELKGNYSPPGGALGRAFDWAVGSAIASATAQRFLQRIGSEMVERYQRDERAKLATEKG